VLENVPADLALVVRDDARPELDHHGRHRREG
jgi:hypothetical protein